MSASLQNQPSEILNNIHSYLTLNDSHCFKQLNKYISQQTSDILIEKVEIRLYGQFELGINGKTIKNPLQYNLKAIKNVEELSIKYNEEEDLDHPKMAELDIKKVTNVDIIGPVSNIFDHLPSNIKSLYLLGDWSISQIKSKLVNLVQLRVEYINFDITDIDKDLPKLRSLHLCCENDFYIQTASHLERLCITRDSKGWINPIMENLDYYQSSFALAKYGILAQESNIQKIEIQNTSDEEEFVQCKSFIKELQCLNAIDIYSTGEVVISELAKVIPELKTQSNEIRVDINQICDSEMEIIQLLNALDKRFQRFSCYVTVTDEKIVKTIKKLSKYHSVSYTADDCFLHVQKGAELFYLSY